MYYFGGRLLSEEAAKILLEEVGKTIVTLLEENGGYVVFQDPCRGEVHFKSSDPKNERISCLVIKTGKGVEGVLLKVVAWYLQNHNSGEN